MSFLERGKHLERDLYYFQAMEVVRGVKKGAKNLDWQGERMGKVGPIVSYWESLKGGLSNLLRVLGGTKGREIFDILTEIILVDTWQEASSKYEENQFSGQPPAGIVDQSEFGTKIKLITEKGGKGPSVWRLVLASPERAKEKNIYLPGGKTTSFKELFYSLKEWPDLPWLKKSLDIAVSLRKTTRELGWRGRGWEEGGFLSSWYQYSLIPDLSSFCKKAAEFFPNNPYLSSVIADLSLALLWRQGKRGAQDQETIFAGEEPGVNWQENYKRMIGYMVGKGDASPFFQVLASSERFEEYAWEKEDLAVGGAVRVEKGEIISFKMALERLLKVR